MKTVDKAISLLSLFGPFQPEIGLSELGRLAAMDKAATHRLLKSLAKHGFVEQNAENKKYRLGAGLLHLARIREATVPMQSIVQPIIQNLAETLGETAHVSMLSGQTLSTIATAEPQRANRAIVDLTEPLPLYATASGFVCLAYSPKKFCDDFLANLQLKRVATNTVTSKAKLREIIQHTYKVGFGRADQSFEDEIIGTAAPIFGVDGFAKGAIAVAAVSSRLDVKLSARISEAVVDAAATITKSTGGILHANFKQVLVP